MRSGATDVTGIFLSVWIVSREVLCELFLDAAAKM